MTIHDHRAPTRPAARPDLGAVVSPGLRWVGSLVWWIEHAFERARADGRPEEDTRVRIVLLLGVFCLVFSVLAVGAARAALFAPKGGVGSASHPGALLRADLTDRNGALMATNITHYGLYIDPSEVWDRRAAFDQIRRALPRADAVKLRRVIFGERRLIVLGGLTPAERAAVHDLALGGVTFEPEDKRVYPLTGGAARLIGAADSGGVGISGLELSFNDAIRAAGRSGEDFPLSIDQRIQAVLETELAAAGREQQAKGVIGVVADARTGEILGMASWPYDRPGNPAVSARYEMGSVFKTFTVAAALDTGQADMNTMLDASSAFMIGNRKIADFHATNRVLSLEEVYLHSSNIGTTRLAVGMGGDVMRDYLTRFGFMEAAPVELKESAKPIRPRDWSDSTLASLSFGYGVSVTPIQMASAMVALANGGRYIPLSFRRGGQTGFQPRTVVSAETSLSMLELMRRNVVAGSGGRAEAAGLRLGGKTGSANKLVNGRYDPTHAVGTFAAVFPADGPVGTQRYVILVLVDEPGAYPRTGGFVAAPAVGRIADRIAPFLGVQRRADPYRTALGEKVVRFEDVEGDGR